MLRDAHFAVRSWRRRPALAAIAIATIAIGIGAATSIFSVVDGVLLRPPALPHPDCLVAIWETNASAKLNAVAAMRWDHISLSEPEFRDLARMQTAFTSVGIWSGARVTLSAGDRAEQVRALRASSTLLATLGVSPFLGRTFTPEEDTPTGARVALISYELWQSEFAAASDIVGRVVNLDDVPTTIVGVLPPQLPLGATLPAAAGPATPLGFWIPVGHDSSDYFERTNHSYIAIGRLRPGVTLARASAEVSRILTPPDGDVGERGTRLTEWQADQTRDVRAPLYVLLVASGMLLLIACVNVATLLLGEVATREREMAARAAVGASPGRLVRQLLTESVVLALAGLTLGVTLAWWGTRVLVALAPAGIPGLGDVHVDLRVLGAALAAALMTGVLFGLAPAATVMRSRPSMLLRGGGQSARGGAVLQRTLIAVELGLSVVLLVGAGLLARTLQRITDVDPGFHAEHLIVDLPSFPHMVARDTTVTRAFQAEVVARLAAIPGVIGVTAADAPPFSGRSSSSIVQPERESPSGGDARDAAPQRDAQQRVTIPGYFAAIGIRLQSGRDFSDADRIGAPFVAIVSNSLARRDFPNEPALGKRLKYQGEWRTIVGVVDDVHFQQLSKDVQPTIYTPVAQRRGAWVLSLLVRTASDPSLVAPQIRKVVGQLAPPATSQRIETMSTMVSRSFAEERYRALLVSLFGIIAAILAAVGIYGVTVRAVSRRTRELAIRSALGASARSIATTVMGGTTIGGAIGVGVGLVAARISTHLLAPFLFGISATDGATYVAIFALLGCVTLGASCVPAVRAARADVAGVLHGE